MTIEPNNTQRATWAKEALAVFTVKTFGGDEPETIHREDLENAIGDLICDLLHFAKQNGFDVGSVVQAAFGHFACELIEETGALHS